MRGLRNILIAIVIGLIPGVAAAQLIDVQPREAWEKIQEGALVLDVRTPREYQAGHIEQSINIPYDEITERAAELPQSKDRLILVYCASGNRASKARAALMELGYSNVTNAGGYDELMEGRPEPRR